MYGKNVQGVEMHFAKGNTSNFVLKRSLKKKKRKGKHRTKFEYIKERSYIEAYGKETLRKILCVLRTG